jgi:DNA polymerase-3 subunit epsilon
VTFTDGHAADAWEALVNPEDYFHPQNISIHGIDEETVRDAPKFPDVFTRLNNVVARRLVVCHTSFDRVALGRAADKYGLPTITCTWLDSAKVARRAWPKFAHRGYGLANVAGELGIAFRHHAAVEDARAAGEIVLRAIADTGRDLEDWLVRITQPLSLEGPYAIRGPGSQRREGRPGNPEGPLAGEVIVFTGALSISRHEAAVMAAQAGCTVADSVTKATTLLVVGDQDIRKLGGHERSLKHRKAEALAAKGQPIRILGECDFHRLLEIENVT